MRSSSPATIGSARAAAQQVFAMTMTPSDAESMARQFVNSCIRDDYVDEYDDYTILSNTALANASYDFFDEEQEREFWDIVCAMQW